MSSSKAKQLLPKLALVFLGGAGTLGVYTYLVQPYLEKRSMANLESEARALYLKRLKQQSDGDDASQSSTSTHQGKIKT
jgi:hypothetical protein